MNATPTPSSEARVSSTMARRYLGQLCKHFEHRLPVTVAGDEGRIDFPTGFCRLESAGGTLTMRLTANDEAALAKLEEVVASHLQRFAFRDKPEVRWMRALS
jgi:hypothetical protein